MQRFDLCANVALPNFNTEPLPGPAALAVRLLPDGGVLAANQTVMARLNASGRLVQTYDVPGEACWPALALDADGSSFWSAANCSSNVYKLDLASGTPVWGFNTGTAPFTIKGLSVDGRPVLAVRVEYARAH